MLTNRANVFVANSCRVHGLNPFGHQPVDVLLAKIGTQKYLPLWVRSNSFSARNSLNSLNALSLCGRMVVPNRDRVVPRA